MTAPNPGRLYIPGGLQLTLKFSIGGQDGAVVLGGVRTTGVPQAASAAVWRDAAWNAFRPLMTTGASCAGAILRDVSGPDGTVYEVGPPATPTGQQAQPTPNLALCTVIKWSTATGGRTGKGRTFLPAIPTPNLASDARTYASNVGPAVATAVTAYLNSTALAAEEITPAVLSFKRGAARPITGGGLASLVGIQRRRLR